MCVCTKYDCRIVFLNSEKAPQTPVFDKKKTALQCLLDTFLLLTFFDAVVIAIAT